MGSARRWLDMIARDGTGRGIAVEATAQAGARGWTPDAALDALVADLRTHWSLWRINGTIRVRRTMPIAPVDVVIWEAVVDVIREVPL